MGDLTLEDRTNAISEAVAAAIVVMHSRLGTDCFDVDLPSDPAKRASVLAMEPVERGILNASAYLKEALEETTYDLKKQIEKTEERASAEYNRSRPDKLFAKDFI